MSQPYEGDSATRAVPGITGKNTDGGVGIAGHATGGPPIQVQKTGVLGDADADGTGVLGNSQSGVGVQGNAVNGLGVAGSSQSGAGVVGTSTNFTGVSGTSGQPGSSTGTGVSGTGRDGVHGVSSLPTGRGVWGENSLGSGYGVSGYSIQGDGVFGQGGSNGVHGQTGSATNSGVWGDNTGGGYGVSGYSLTGQGTGVYGRGNGPGVYGESNLSDGVHGLRHSRANPGVYGESDTYEGVRGISHSAHGAIVGINDGKVITVEGAGPGVYGTSAASDGVKGSVFSGYVQGPAVVAGVWGENTGTGAGVKGTSQGGDGVLGFSSAGGHAGVSANNLGGGMGLYASGNPAGHFQGNVEVTGDLCLVNQDCAEDFEVKGTEVIEPGTVMVIDKDGALQISECAYDKRVAGVISGAGNFKPAIILGRQKSQERTMPIALVGRVYCKADASASPIEVGDLLTTSSTAGYAMKALDPLKSFGAVIGKALRPLATGLGLIPILIALQ